MVLVRCTWCRQIVLNISFMIKVVGRVRSSVNSVVEMISSISCFASAFFRALTRKLWNVVLLISGISRTVFVRCEVTYSVDRVGGNVVSVVDNVGLVVVAVAIS